MDLNVFKDTTKLDLITAAHNYLHIELKPLGIYQKCPACGGRSSFIVNTNNTYKCHKPSCDLWKGGNLFTFFKWAGYSYQETCSLLNIKSDSLSKPVITDTRSHRLIILLEECKERLLRTPNALNYIESRYNIHLEDLNKPQFEIGYANCLPELNYYNEDRIIFPVRDHYGGLVHFHTRSMDPDSAYRWLPTTKLEGGRPFGDYIWNAHLYHKRKELFLTEGISDGITLSKLGLPTISMLSLTAPIVELLQKFNNLENLTVILDNDKVPLNERTKTKVYKSWDATDSSGHSIVSKLLQLAILKPNLKIWCLMPPSMVGIKDVNDWVCKHKHTKKSFIEVISKRARLITDFAIEYYWNDTSKHSLIIKSINTKASEDLFVSKLVVNYTDWLDYIKTIV